MVVIKLITYVSIIILLSSCSFNAPLTSPVGSTTNENMQILFFSDESKLEQEDVYYDALLELKKEYPQAINNMRVYQPTSKKNPFKVETYPSLLIIDHDKIIVEIEGSISSKEEILSPIKRVLAN